ncbi:MAG TPA: hypothetical protein DDW72_12600, partial [Afipia sp.]|nr:hypothetical protein [Afipia sp.]
MSCKAAGIYKPVRKSGSKARSFADRLRRGLRPSAFALAVLLSCLSIAAEAAPADPVKGEATLTAQPGYARLILKFKEDVPTEVIVAGAILVIQFKNSVDVPIDLLADSAPAYVGSVRRDPDGTAIRMALTQKVSVNVMTAGERVFIDLLPEKWVGLPPALPAEVVKELSERALAAERALRIQKIADEAKKRPPVRVRASVQPTFVRFVFEMPDGVNVSSSLGTEKFTLSFTAPLVFDLADAKIAMPANITSINQKIDGEASRVDIALVGEADIHSFREDKNYVVDVAFEPSQKPQTVSPAKSSVPGDKASEFAQPTSEQIARLMKPDAKPSEIKPPEVKQPDVKPVDAKPPAPSPEAKTEAVIAKPEPAAPAPTPAVVAEAPAPVKVPPVASPPAVKAPPPEVATAKPAAGVTVEARLTSDDLRLTFPFSTPTAAAVFRRSDSIWLVFDTDQAIDTGAVRRDGGWIVADVEPVDLPKGRALRIRLNRPQLANLIGDERAWTLVLADKALPPQQPL